MKVAHVLMGLALLVAAAGSVHQMFFDGPPGAPNPCPKCQIVIHK